LISVFRRCWGLKGECPTAPYQTKYEWGYVYGAADIVTGEAIHRKPRMENNRKTQRCNHRIP